MHTEPNELTGKKLTKKNFLELPEGFYLVSNVGHSITQPIFAEFVDPLEKRLQQWERIKSVKANNRLCRTFRNEEQYLAWMSKSQHYIQALKHQGVSLSLIKGRRDIHS